MPNFFKVDNLSGHIGRIDSRDKYTLFSVAYNQKAREGEEKPTCWFQCKAVGKAHPVLSNMGKGDGIVITNMIPEVWKDRDGNERWTWIVFDAHKYEKKETGGNSGGYSEPPAFDPDDDLPFARGISIHDVRV